MKSELEAPALARRMACWVYEGLLVLAVVFIAGYLFGSLSQTRNAMDNRYALQAFLFIVLGIYFVWFWSKGQTLAMKTWGITVVDRTGKPITQAGALLRYLLCWFWFLPGLAVLVLFKLSGADALAAELGGVAIWAILSRLHPGRQFWHDAMAGTRLIPSVTPSVDKTAAQCHVRKP